MKVLYVAEPGDVNPWYQDFVAALGDGFEVPVWARGQPFASQVQDAVAVVNVGPFFEPDMVPAARAEGRIRREPP